MTTRVGNYAQQERNLAYIMDAMNRLNTAQIQVSSGLKSQDYSGISTDSRRLVNVQATETRTNQYVKNNNLVDQRLQTMETNVSQIFDTLTNYKTLLVNGLNANNANDLAMTTQAQGYLDQITSLLNVQDDGRYLFSGSRTDTQPVDESKLPVSYTVPSSDGDASGYYQGDSTQLSVRADTNYTVTYGITAGEQGFERGIRSIDEVIKGAPGDRATMEDALSIVNNALTDVSNIRSRIGAAQKALEDTNSRHQDYLTYSDKTISDIQNVDVTQAITQMNSDQVSVEASYQVIGRLSQLNLMNYLH